MRVQPKEPLEWLIRQGPRTASGQREEILILRHSHFGPIGSDALPFPPQKLGRAFVDIVQTETGIDKSVEATPAMTPEEVVAWPPQVRAALGFNGQYLCVEMSDPPGEDCTCIDCAGN